MLGYGGFIWSKDNIEEQQSNFISNGQMVAAATIAGAGLYATTKLNANSLLHIDNIYSSLKLTENLSPFQILSTFRTTEFLSPSVSDRLKGVQGSFTWNKAQLESSDTYHYLKKITGLSDKNLRTFGLTPGMKGDPSELAHSLEYVPGEGLFSVTKDKRNLLSKHISLIESTAQGPIPGAKNLSLNKGAHAVFQALDMWSLPNFSPNNVFFQREIEGAQEAARARLMPVPSISGPRNTIEDLQRRSTLMRAIPAFEMQRFNNLLNDVGTTLFGKDSNLNKLLGNITPGKATDMFARYGVKMAGLGAIMLGVSELDWARRNTGIVGNVFASGIVSAGAGFIAHKMNRRPETTALIAGLSFAGQILLPGYDQGVVPGIATTLTTIDVARANDFNPFNYYRRSLEGFFPGVSSWETGALLGIGLGFGSAVTIPGINKRLPEFLHEKFGHDLLKLPEKLIDPTTVRDLFWEDLGSKVGRAETRGLFNRLQTGYDFLKNVHNEKAIDAIEEANVLFAKAHDAYKSIDKNVGVNSNLLDRLKEISTQYPDTGFLNTVKREFSGTAAQAYYSFFGADSTLMKEEISKLGLGKGLSPIGKLGRFGTLGAVALLGQQLLSGGFLGSMENAEDLRAIYSGDRYVQINRNRWWLSGSSAYSGSSESYFRPHAYVTMMNRSREKAVWGSDEDRLDPISKFLLKNFTYTLEEKHFYDRPYPISSAAFSDIPIIGGILGSTVGRLIKPARLMHENEYVREGSNGGLEYAQIFEGARREPAYELGANQKAIPISQFHPAQQALEISNQFRQLSGLTGWAKNVIQSGLTGKDEWSVRDSVLADAGQITSFRREFWDMALGDAFGQSELWRRVFPSYSSEQEQYNPIRNTAPSWLPDKFKFGDPYTKIPWGEVRLPGTGYSSIYPDVEGIDPESYPALHKFNILADVAPLSMQFRMIQEQVYRGRQEGLYNDREQALIDEIDIRVAKQVNQVESNLVTPGAIELPGSSITQASYLGMQNFIRGVASPEFLTPFRPVRKLLGEYKDPISRYEDEQVYGTTTSFWTKPYTDFLRPAIYSTAHFMGYNGKPLWKKEAENINQYFDEIEFIKWMKLAEQASVEGNNSLASRYEYEANRTRTGVNPHGNPLAIYWSLPENERAYFNAFANADPGDRNKILQLMPQDQGHLYKTLWSRLDSGDPSLQGPLNENDISSPYLRGRYYNVLGESTNLPPEDWIGWNSSVDLGDIKVKYVENMAGDIHDYQLWERDSRKAADQPFLEGSDEVIQDPSSVMRASLYRKMRAATGQFGNFNIIGGKAGTNVNFNDDRNDEIRNRMNGAMYGY